MTPRLAPLVALLALAVATPAPAIAAEAPPGAGACVIRGTGECRIRNQDARSEDPRPFPVFASSARTRRVAEVPNPQTVAVAWSQLPPVGAAAARVHIASDGLQLGGWATVRDRLFQLEERADVVPDRLWARRGAPVRILGIRDQLLLVEVETSPATMRSPQRIELTTACGNLAYQTERLTSANDGAPSSSGVADPTTGSLTLSAQPGQPPFLRLVLSAPPRPSFWSMEVRGRWVRVSGGDSVMGFDAWVPAWQVSLNDGGLGLGNLSGSGRRWSPMNEPHVGVARRDATVSVGARGPEVAIGVLLAGTRVRLEGETPGEASVPFALAGREVVPPEGQRFWVATEDVDDIGVGVVFPEHRRP